MGHLAPSAIPLKPGVSVRILALGDQSPIASSAPPRYQAELAKLLAQGGYRCEFAPGFEGLRIDQIASDKPVPIPGRAPYPGLAATLSRGKPNIILAMLGLNDILQDYAPGRKHGDPGFTPDAVLRLNSLIDDIYYKDPRATVIVATLPPLRDPALDKTVQYYNSLIPTVVSTRQRHQDRIALADIGSALAPADLSADGVTPSSAGYAKIANVWEAALTANPAAAKQ